MHGTPRLTRLLPLLALALLGALLPQFVPQYYLYIGNVLMMYAVLALGLDLLLGWAGQFAFAHIAFFGVGAYGTVLLQSRLGLPKALTGVFQGLLLFTLLACDTLIHYRIKRRLAPGAQGA